MAGERAFRQVKYGYFFGVLMVMSTFTHDQKVALLVVPILLFGVLGLSSGGVGVANLFEENASVRMRPGAQGAETGGSSIANRVRAAIQKRNYKDFVAALTSTPYREYATPAVFDALIVAYQEHTDEQVPFAHTEYLRRLDS